MPEIINIAGQRFGRLVAISPTEKRYDRKVIWSCVCDCGNHCDVNGKLMRRGLVKSCGCLRIETASANGKKRFIHGHAAGTDRSKKPESATYAAWTSMIDRCTNQRHRAWEHYGGRGIKVCDRWLHSFPAFLLDMGTRPRDDLSLDRIVNDGNYEPGNCRWATRSQQQQNKRPTEKGRSKRIISELRDIIAQISADATASEFDDVCLVSRSLIERAKTLAHGVNKHSPVEAPSPS